jgi:hypothetical protein
MTHPTLSWFVALERRRELDSDLDRKARARAWQWPRRRRLSAAFRLPPALFELRPRSTPAPAPSDAVTIRRAVSADAQAVETLALLEGRPVPPGTLLLAEVEGVVEAVLSLQTHEALANPFARTAGLVRLLDLRAEEIVEAEQHCAQARRISWA